ncbi:MAG: hypothetical protein VKJ06_04580 [Vampirovibrionales bacterium]|nr:hypothetical protein [Vampirovibrionales bacterium]
MMSNSPESGSVEHPQRSRARRTRTPELNAQVGPFVLPPLLALPEQVSALPDEATHSITKRVGRVAAQMVQQLNQHTGALANTQTVFNQMLDMLPEVSQAFEDAFTARQKPSSELARRLAHSRIAAQIDPDRSVGLMHVLWQTLSFTTRGNTKPLALALPGQSPRFCGRIIALHGDFFELSSRCGETADFACLLEHEIASLYVPEDPMEPFVMTMRHATDVPSVKLYPADAARQFLMRTIEMVCCGGFLHEQPFKSL